jgi:mono/diheme cytochrome c family protein/glucose/arabinose dehydrogenase
MYKLVKYFLLLLTACFLVYCQANKPKESKQAMAVAETKVLPSEKIDFTVSPVISPQQSIQMMQVEDGFEVKLVAAEPLISAPVALSFDGKGRIWVIEMNGYMPDTIGTGEDIPSGKIVILEDSNNDGLADNRKVFLDSLVLPRAICLIEDGILVAEPPRLWYYPISDDQPGKKVLVDDKYTEGGNVEHQPNGLYRAMDNWIYNAKSTKRYRKRGNTWEIDRTHFRGQWGLSQDNYGRLYYNTNSENLLGDYFTPGLGATNTNQRSVAGYVKKIVADNKVYPARPTPGVNRGYMKGILNDSLQLVDFTAACGPLVYRGELFGPNYASNVFVAEPSANLIKRNILSEQGYVVNGNQAYRNKEFLRSLDERFRPVNLHNAPDGALYIVDMYRGIIQHKTYLTTYLKKEIGLRQLTQPLTSGRIYKVVPKGKAAKMSSLPEDATGLVKLLAHDNGWIRDYAQQKLIDRKLTEAIPALRQALQEKNKPLLVMHALWTLEGLGALTTEEVRGMLQEKVWPMRMQALSVLPSVLTKTSYTQYLPVLTQMLEQKDTLAAPYVAFLAHYIQPFDPSAADKLLAKATETYPNNSYVADAVISNLEGRESVFLSQVTASVPDTNTAIHKQLQRVTAYIANKQASRNPEMLKKQFPKGVAMFTTICQTCHGQDGNGVASLGPPLNQSEWVTGDKEKLISIVLYGLTGPVEVKGHLYKAPEINGDMPGIGYNKDLSDEDVAQLLSFIRKSWRNDAAPVKAEDVVKTREKLKGRQKAFTVEELNKI